MGIDIRPGQAQTLMPCLILRLLSAIIRKEVVEYESTLIWDLGKRLGTTCSRDEGMLIKE